MRAKDVVHPLPSSQKVLGTGMDRLDVHLVEVRSCIRSDGLLLALPPQRAGARKPTPRDLLREFGEVLDVARVDFGDEEGLRVVRCGERDVAERWGRGVGEERGRDGGGGDVGYCGSGGGGGRPGGREVCAARGLRGGRVVELGSGGVGGGFGGRRGGKNGGGGWDDGGGGGRGFGWGRKRESGVVHLDVWRLLLLLCRCFGLRRDDDLFCDGYEVGIELLLVRLSSRLRCLLELRLRFRRRTRGERRESHVELVETTRRGTASAPPPRLSTSSTHLATPLYFSVNAANPSTSSPASPLSPTRGPPLKPAPNAP